MNDEDRCEFTLNDASTYAWEDVLSNATSPVCTHYYSLLAARAKALDDEGDGIGGALFRLLADVASYHMDLDDRDCPFKPFFVIDGKRSAALDDLGQWQLDILDELKSSTQAPAMRARIADVVWIARKDHKAAKIACESYLQSFKDLEAENDRSSGIDYLRRGFGLAPMFGRAKELHQEYETCLVSLIQKRAPSESGHFCSILMDLLIDHNCGEHSELATIATEIAERVEKTGNFFVAIAYADSASRLYRRAELDEESRQAELLKGRLTVELANQALNVPNQGYLGATVHLANAIEILRRAAAPKEDVEELHNKLLDWQRKSTGEMKATGSQTDISKVVEKARESVTGKTLSDAVLTLAFGHPLVDLEALRERVQEHAAKAPLASLFAATMSSSDGRKIDNKPSLLSARSGSVDDGEGLIKEMLFQARQCEWPLRALGYIDPCREQIFSEHRPSQRDLTFLVLDNPFVPPGHEGLFLRGLHAGFTGDMMLCAHLLVPQIEESLRYVLASNGVITSKLDAKLVQEVKLLGTLLGMPETRQIFGEDAVFELEGILCAKWGFDLRNRLAHGFLTTGECFGIDVLLAWWLVLRLCAFPVYTRTITDKKSPSVKEDLNKTE